MKSDEWEPTESLCPVCLARVPAERRFAGEEVRLEGHCPDHGMWSTLIWSGPPSYRAWCADKGAVGCSVPREAVLSTPSVCPLACGLCPEHQQSTCTAVLEITRRCNLVCPICFAESRPDTPDSDPSLRELEATLRDLFIMQGSVNLQLSGGEPTLRADLPDIISLARATGFEFVQLNTNGLRLAQELEYAEKLRDAGLVSVFLQFDGLMDATHRAIRGRAFGAEKLQAVERCAEAGLAVVLVPTVVAGVNDGELGALVDFATEWAGVVRGVHFQPVSYFGRYPVGERPRLTLPEILRALESQTGSRIKADDFEPSSCEHVRCSFRARYWVRDDGRLELVRSETGACAAELNSAARRAVAATARQWSLGSVGRNDYGSDKGDTTGAACDDLDRFLEAAGRILAVSGMLFQDAWDLDLERVRRCCVHALVPGRGLIPFCLWNLTSESGKRLYLRTTTGGP